MSMLGVNLLPHRRLKREARQRQFGIAAGSAVATAALILFMGWTFLEAKTDSQTSRNKRLDDATAVLDKQITEIKDLKEQIKSLLERKQIVENLQGSRSQTVVILDEISRQLPEGMYIKSLKQVGPLISIEGVSDSNARVATIIQTLSVSEHLESPELVEIKSMMVGGIKQNEFKFNVKIKDHSAAVDEINDKSAKDAKKNKGGSK